MLTKLPKMKVNVQRPSIWLGLLSLGVWTVPAYAGTSTNTVAVLATVDDRCYLNTTPLLFGTVPILSGVVDGTANISIKCPPGTNYSVSIDNGLNFNGQRRMVSDAGALPFFRYVPYEIYRDAARTQIWGSTAGRTMSGTMPSTGTASLTIYGRVPRAIVLPTPYRDTLTVTMDF
jgi:spore coat protein U-like protein